MYYYEKSKEKAIKSTSNTTSILATDSDSIILEVGRVEMENELKYKRQKDKYGQLAHAR